jgi:putative ABC transport system permease protein
VRRGSRFWTFFRRNQMENELAEELQFHLEERTAALMQQGFDRRSAERQARIEFGAVEAYKDQCREAKGLRLISELKADVRYAFRTLKRSPLFTAAAISTLALGIAVNTSVFSVLDHVLLRSFPYPNPDRLVLLWTGIERLGSKVHTSFPNYLDWRAQQTVFDDLGAMMPTTFYIRTVDYPDKFLGYRATASFFDTLGVKPQIGRIFTSQEERHEGVVLISDSCWTNRFGRNPDAVGKVLWLSLNGAPQQAFTIIGVLPKSFEAAFPTHSEMWGPIPHDNEEVAERSAGGLQILARLKEGISFREAELKMNVIAARLNAQYPDTNKGHSVTIEGLHENLTTGQVQATVPVLMGAVGFVLLLACVNVLNLMLARGVERDREMATRMSLGAGPFRIFRQLMTEAVVLCLCGGVAGAVLAYIATGLIRQSIPTYVLRRGDISVDARVLLFTFAITLVASMMAGLLPALRGSNVAINRFLHTGRTSAARQRNRFQSSLVVAEVALGMILLVGAGLLINTFIRLLHVDAGFDQRNLLAVQTHLNDGDTFKDDHRRFSAIESLVEGLRGIGGVEHVGVTDFRPLSNTMNTIANKTTAAGTRLPMNLEAVAADYFEAMGIRRLHGRLFTPHDSFGSPYVAIINEVAAAKYWPGGDPLGQHIFASANGATQQQWRIVGVVSSVRRNGPDREAPPAFYVPQAQAPSRMVELLIRTRDGVRPAELVSAVRKEMAKVHTSIAADSVDIMDEVVAGRLARHRFFATFMSFFGLLALLMTASGIFGMMAYSVRLRSHEMAVRLALGAARQDIFRLVIGQSVVWTVLGLAIGIGAALAGGRVLKSFLFGVEANDAATYIAVAAVLATTALIAAWAPSRHASRVDPAETLRLE